MDWRKGFPSTPRDNPGVENVGNNLSKLVRTVMAIPASSADAERAFSILKHIKSSRRSRLSYVTVDDLLRIWLNGPSRLDDFPSARLAKKYTGVHVGNPRDAGGRPAKRKLPTETDSSSKRMFGVPLEVTKEVEADVPVPEEDVSLKME